MKSSLTEKQQKVLEFIQNFIQQNGFVPSEREIARKLRIKWVRAVQKHLDALEKKGYLQKGGGIRRGIKLRDVAFGTGTPILGRITAGQPILAVENVEGYLTLDATFSKQGKTFLLNVVGMSMKDAGILDGDLVLVRQQSSAENGDIVAALIGDEATVKRFRRTNEAILLEPENTDFQPIVVMENEQFTILGKVIASLRILDNQSRQSIFTHQ
ncbi:MAG: transcriptional repressor LexA [Ignavibacteriae bacterium]|nr:transcriptional repressor LexA [Ignavibacteriota bacterium]